MIIHSLLDTDLYKFTMMQVVLHHFPAAMVEYHFKCRDEQIDLTPYMDEMNAEIDHYCSLRMQPDELAYLEQFSFFKPDFIQFLQLFKPNRDFIRLEVREGEFDVVIKGPWLHTIVFEVPILAIISEVYLRHIHAEPDYTEGEHRLREKIAYIQKENPDNDFCFSDFGTRRRFSHVWQEKVIALLKHELPNYFIGTSNVYFAKKLGLKPIGTMAHEYIQACQSLGPRLLYSQRFAFETWAQEYRGDLGIALSDTYSLDAFLNDFDLYFCKLFDGARQDSGDPFAWGERVIAHYEKMRVNPKTKVLVFSDSLTMPKAIALYRHFHERVGIAFGIGTHLTNDVGQPFLDMVIKMTSCNGQPVAKVSDEPGKTICKDESYLAYLRHVFKIS